MWKLIYLTIVFKRYTISRSLHCHLSSTMSKSSLAFQPHRTRCADGMPLPAGWLNMPRSDTGSPETFFILMISKTVVCTVFSHVVTLIFDLKFSENAYHCPNKFFFIHKSCYLVYLNGVAASKLHYWQCCSWGDLDLSSLDLKFSEMLKHCPNKSFWLGTLKCYTLEPRYNADRYKAKSATTLIFHGS